ncbi:MAG: hypothetical protein V1792_25895 [Pseudomonadota bacterium]
MNQNPRLNALSRIFALSNGGNCRNVILAALVFDAPLEPVQVRQAFGKTTHLYPQFAAVLRRRRAGLRHLHYFQPIPQDERDTTMVEILRPPEAQPGTDIFEHVVSLLEPRLDRKRDLAREAAAKVFLIEINDSASVLALLVDHWAADAWVASEFMRRMMNECNGGMTEIPPIVSGREQPLSIRVPQGSQTRRPGRGFAWREVRSFWPRKADTGTPLGTGSLTDQGYTVSRVALNSRETRFMRAKAGDLRVNVVDLLTASAHLAIAEWNGLRDVDTSTITTSMSVPVRDMMHSPDEPNGFAVIHLGSDAAQRCERESLPLIMYRQRKQLAQSGMPWKQRQFMSYLVSLGSLLPESLQRRITSLLFNGLHWYRAAMQINYFGALAPESVDGRMTGKSEVITCGQARCVDVFGFPYKTVPTATPVQVHAFEYREAFQMTVGSWSCNFSGSELREFARLLGESLLRT